MQKKIIYWSPHLTHIGTINSVINSANSLVKFSNKKYKVCLLNLFGEWSNLDQKLNENKITLINIFNPKINKFLPKNSFLKSRFTYIVFFIFSFFKLRKILKYSQDSILIIHLLTSLPLLVTKLFNLKIKIILRISGRVKLNPIRMLIWKLCKDKITCVTCPSNETKNEIIKLGIFNEDKITTLYDPILEPKKINLLKNKVIEDEKILNKKIILSIGRLTKQKNFVQLIKSFNEINKKNPEYFLIILGSGEEKNKLNQIIKSLKLEKKIFLLGFEKNVFKYIKHCEIFISSSKYEDPGASIIQAAYCNKFIISSNCKNGPSEILLNGEGGILYNLDNENIENCFEIYQKLGTIEKREKIFKAKKNIMKYSLLRHFNVLNKLIERL